jgi:hypothetical protein
MGGSAGIAIHIGGAIGANGANGANGAKGASSCAPGVGGPGSWPGGGPATVGAGVGGTATIVLG